MNRIEKNPFAKFQSKPTIKIFYLVRYVSIFFFIVSFSCANLNLLKSDDVLASINEMKLAKIACATMINALERRISEDEKRIYYRYGVEYAIDFWKKIKKLNDAANLENKRQGISPNRKGEMEDLLAFLRSYVIYSIGFFKDLIRLGDCDSEDKAKKTELLNFCIQNNLLLQVV